MGGLSLSIVGSGDVAVEIGVFILLAVRQPVESITIANTKTINIFFTAAAPQSVLV